MHFVTQLANMCGSVGIVIPSTLEQGTLERTNVAKLLNDVDVSRENSTKFLEALIIQRKIGADGSSTMWQPIGFIFHVCLIKPECHCGQRNATETASER
jgi:hypothetical protein